MSCSRATFLPVHRQPMHITLPVPEQQAHRSAPATAAAPASATPRSGLTGSAPAAADAAAVECAAPTPPQEPQMMYPVPYHARAWLWHGRQCSTVQAA